MRIMAWLMAALLTWNGFMVPVQAKDGHHPAASGKRILVLYSTPLWPWQSDEQSKDYARMVQNLLGHFPVETEIMEAEKLSPEKAATFQGFVYVGVDERGVPQALEQVVEKGEKPVLWLGENLSELPGRILKGLTIGEREKVRLTHTYRGHTITDRQEVKLPLLEAGQEWEALALGRAGERTYPVLVRKSKLWYMPYLDFWQGGYLIWADALHDILDLPGKEAHRAFLRIEDIHPLRDPAKLRQIADYLAERQVPFVAAVIPVYVNPAKGETVYLRDRPEVAEAIRYMVEKGGTVVLHGYTHQFGDEETGVGYEFWDSKQERLPDGDLTPYIAERVEQGIADLAELGIYPVAYMPPHYIMPETGYVYLRSKFNTLLGCVQVSDRNRATQKFPYVIRKDRHGFRVVPENLGYLDPQEEDPAGALLQEAQNILAVRDGMVGFFFHPYLDLNLLKRSVEGLQGMGYVFHDLREEKNRLAYSGLVVSSEEGSLYVEDSRKYWPHKVVSRFLQETASPPHKPELYWLGSGAGLMLILLLWIYRRNIST